MKTKIEQGSKWQTPNGDFVFVRRVFDEDGESFVWYSEHTADRTYECSPEEFVKRFKETSE